MAKCLFRSYSRAVWLSDLLSLVAGGNLGAAREGGWRTLDLLILILQSFHTLSHIQLKTETMHVPPEYVGIFLERTILDYKLVEVPKYTLLLETISYPPSFEIIQDLYPLPITFPL